MTEAGDFLAIFDREYAPRLAHRAPPFRAVFELLSQRKEPCIVETGCAREPDNWRGDGQSTVLFDKFIEHHGGQGWSVDINADSVDCARRLTKNMIVNRSDSVAFLAKFKSPIDLLYLDSFDFDGNEPLKSAHHHLYELCAAMPHLRPGSIVLVDDMSRTIPGFFGKGMLVAEFFDKTNVPIFCEGERQVAWML